MRPIINPRHLNEFIEHHHFKIENLNSYLPLIQPGTFFTSISLQDTYFSLSIDPSHQTFLLFLWRDALIEFQVICFGVSSALRSFTKVLKPIYLYCRIIGMICSYYLDDRSHFPGDFETYRNHF